MQGAWDETRIALHQRADVLGVEAVDVLLRRDGLSTVAVEMLRQRQLHEDAVDLRIGIEFAIFASTTSPATSVG